MQNLQIQKPVEVLFEGVDTSKYFETKSDLDLSSIPESFCFLSVGHWLHGSYGNDRKNLGFTVRSFLDTFKNKQNPPALIMKTSHATTSLLDKTNLLKKIDSIKKTLKGKLPNIYVLHGDITDQEINSLYNHPKVKAMVSHTRGEGFGRPLLEFSMTGKPIIASGWSGQVDFLNPKHTNLLPGTLTKLDPSSVVKAVLLPDSQWFKVDEPAAIKAYKMVFKHYKKYITPAKKLKHENKEKFSYSAMVESLKILMEKYVTDTKPQPKLSKLSLPKLKKV